MLSSVVRPDPTFLSIPQQNADANDQSAHYSETVWGGVRGGLAGLAVGGAGAFAMQRGQVQAFTRLTLPLKAFAVT